MPANEIKSRNLVSSSDKTGSIDISQIRRKFGNESPARLYCCLSAATSDLSISTAAYDENDEHFWGTEHDWKVVNDEALTSDEFDEVAQYLRISGQASI